MVRVHAGTGDVGVVVHYFSRLYDNVWRQVCRSFFGGGVGVVYSYPREA